MTVFDLHSNVEFVSAVPPQTVTSGGGAVVSGDLDLAGFLSAEVMVLFGSIVEMPGGGSLSLRVEHAEDDGSGAPGPYSDVADPDVIGATGVAGVVVATATDDAERVQIGYRGGRRFLRVTLSPSGLTTGGPMGALLVKGHPRHAPRGQAQL